MGLETEIARYEELLPELLRQYGEGKYAVICGRDLVGVFDTSDEGYTAGLETVGIAAPFLLRPISRVQRRFFLPSVFVRHTGV